MREPTANSLQNLVGCGWRVITAATLGTCVNTRPLHGHLFIDFIFFFFWFLSALNIVIVHDQCTLADRLSDSLVIIFVLDN